MSHWLDDAARGLSEGRYNRRQVLARGGTVAGGALVASVTGPIGTLTRATAATLGGVPCPDFNSPCLFPDTCCGGHKCCDHTTEFCCGGSCIERAPGEVGCCHDSTYDPRTDKCCPHAEKGNASGHACSKHEKCCGERACCDHRTEFCCGGSCIERAPGEVGCCHDSTYDPRTDKCCPHAEKGNASGHACSKHEKCCGATECCKKGEQCCSSGKLAYCARKGHCCPKGQHRVTCGGGKHLCCPEDEYCCGGTCCKSGQCANGHCCATGQTPCGTGTSATCCNPSDCNNGVCGQGACSPSHPTGSCPSGQTCCGGYCCPSGFCEGGQCGGRCAPYCGQPGAPTAPCGGSTNGCCPVGQCCSNCYGPNGLPYKYQCCPEYINGVQTLGCCGSECCPGNLKYGTCIPWNVCI